IVAGNKCDLQESRRVPAATGLEWARKRGCGFMETSARLEVNIEETFALIVRRVVEARRLARAQAAAPAPDRPAATSRGATKPLTPLPPPGDDEAEAEAEKRGPGRRGPNIRADRLAKGDGGFWRKLRCW
ncbi:hypothetical protein VTH06DRAFT_5479, partial [Thermothelomyces fergusii]